MSTRATGDIPETGVTAATERCGQCGAPAAPEQRYCLNCGFHRRNAVDPVARYLSEASVARAQVAAATALAAQRRRAPRIGVRLAVLLVALALLVGVLIGSATAGHSAPGRSTTTGAARTSTTGTAKHSSKTKSATGSSYLQQEQNLPNSVSP
jgi:hypothetical protein